MPLQDLNMKKMFRMMLMLLMKITEMMIFVFDVLCVGSHFWDTGCWRKYFRKENPGINYLLHIESNESRKNMVPENSKTIYANSKNP